MMVGVGLVLVWFFVWANSGLVGLLTHDWSEWREEMVINEYYKPFVKETQNGGGRLCA